MYFHKLSENVHLLSSYKVTPVFCQGVQPPPPTFWLNFATFKGLNNTVLLVEVPSLSLELGLTAYEGDDKVLLSHLPVNGSDCLGARIVP